jgi:hypothetical protein
MLSQVPQISFVRHKTRNGKASWFAFGRYVVWISHHCSRSLSPEMVEQWSRWSHHLYPFTKSFLILRCIINTVLKVAFRNQTWFLLLYEFASCRSAYFTFLLLVWNTGYNWLQLIAHLLSIRMVPCSTPSTPEGRLSCLRYFAVFLSPSRQILG